MKLAIIRALLSQMSVSDLLVYVWQVLAESDFERSDQFREQISRGAQIEWRIRND